MKRRTRPPRIGTYENPYRLDSIHNYMPYSWHILTKPRKYYKKVLTAPFDGHNTVISGWLGKGTKIFIGEGGKCRVARFTPSQVHGPRSKVHGYYYSHFCRWLANTHKYTYTLGKEARIHRLSTGYETCARGIHGYLTLDGAKRHQF